jgi:hypothetical protein
MWFMQIITNVFKIGNCSFNCCMFDAFIALNHVLQVVANRKILHILLIICCLPFSVVGQEDGVEELISYIYSLHDEVSDPNKQVGNLNQDSLPSLPIGLMKEIGGTKYIIAIDSAEFTPTGAYFNAYMAVELPGCTQRLAFAAKHIQFNPKGVVSGALTRLQLVSEHHIQIGPHTELFLPENGNNYVEWDCNGFIALGLEGAFRFSQGMLIPTDGNGDVIADTAAMVQASFQAYVQDINNLMVSVNFTPFKVKGVEDFSFTISEAWVDMNDFGNPTGIVYPPAYPGDVSPTWRGFFIRDFIVKLPEKFSKNDNRVSLFGHNMLIDDAGVSGVVGATNVFSTSEGDMSSWGFSLDSLAVYLTANQLTGGTLAGKVIVPALDDAELNYIAVVTQNGNQGVDYNFTVQPSEMVTLNMFDATLDLLPTSAAYVDVVNGKFKPTLVLTGSLNLNNESLQFSQVDFQDFTIVTHAPYITNGIFSLTSSSASNEANNMGNFPLQVNNITLGLSNGQVALGASIAFNLSQANAGGNGFSASTDVMVVSHIAPDEQGDMEFAFDKLVVNTVHLSVSTNAFGLKGAINFYHDDPIYGKGFSGAMVIIIESVMDDSMLLACQFGRVDGMRYYMIDATVPVDIQVGTSTVITSVRGGISNRMRGSKPMSVLISEIANGAPLNGNPSQQYVPDAAMGLIFRAGVGFKMKPTEEQLNGDVMFEIGFNSNGGLQHILLTGNGYSLCKRADRATAQQYFRGAVSIYYDNQNSILDISMTAEAVFSGNITGMVGAHLYFSPSEWFIKIGTPTNQGWVNVANLAYANAYFMMGQNLPPMPPPPSQVTNVFDEAGLALGRDESAITGGNGVALGMSLNISFDKSMAFGAEDQYSIYASGSGGAGFDLTAMNYGPTAHCLGSSNKIGMNGWYLMGQLYAYIYLNVGVTGRFLGNDFDLNILDISAAMLLQGKLPKPSYIYGAVALNATLFSVIHINLSYDFDFGTNCNIIQ